MIYIIVLSLLISATPFVWLLVGKPNIKSKSSQNQL